MPLSILYSNSRYYCYYRYIFLLSATICYYGYPGIIFLYFLVSSSKLYPDRSAIGKQ